MQPIPAQIQARDMLLLLQDKDAYELVKQVKEDLKASWIRCTAIMQALGIAEEFRTLSKFTWANATRDSRVMHVPWSPAGSLVDIEQSVIWVKFEWKDSHWTRFLPCAARRRVMGIYATAILLTNSTKRVILNMFYSCQSLCIFLRSYYIYQCPGTATEG